MSASPLDGAGAVRLLPLRMTCVLAATALVQASVATWALGPGLLKLPLAGVVSAGTVPLLLGGVAMVLAVFTAPLLLGASDPGWDTARWTLARASVAAAWQAAVLGFMLLAVSRLTPVDSRGILLACTWLGLCALMSILLARLAPWAFAGVMFFWACAVPVCCYMVAELFLAGPGGNVGWSQATGPHVQGLRATVHWGLGLSPGTSLAGALTGVLPDGTEYAAGVPFMLMCMIGGLLGWGVVRRCSREAGGALGRALA
ncbi:MAG: hypothetical protein NTW87_34085 [Planctomycetota bacterium]|nr:hypothetical protein [Planctomycetota bacterium]